MADTLQTIRDAATLPRNVDLVHLSPGSDDYDDYNVGDKVILADAEGNTIEGKVTGRAVSNAVEIFNRWGPMHYDMYGHIYLLAGLVDHLRKTYKGPKDFDLTKTWTAVSFQISDATKVVEASK